MELVLEGYNSNMLPGHAEPDATSEFSGRFANLRAAGFYRQADGLAVSSLGIGSYLGALDEKTDEAYTKAMAAAVHGGINFIDTSLNYRHQRSELSIGKAIFELIAAGEVRRNEIAVCTKAGYLVPNATPVLNPADVVGRMHCLAPEFLNDQLERSRINLGLETIDVFYLHNPETQLKAIAQDDFYSRIQAAFEILERKVSEGRIRFYGAATWDGFRKADGLSLPRMAEIARAVGGPEHRFRFIQMPINLAMREAMEGKPETILDAAARLGISVVSSASLLQARLAQTPPDAKRALQFSLSVPGVTVALVGMSNAAHVKENLAIIGGPER